MKKVDDGMIDPVQRVELVPEPHERGRRDE